MRYRFERFGGIIGSEQPPFLAFVDQEYMRELGLGPSPLWTPEATEVGLLTAPTEVHLALTGACTGGCTHCYMGAGAAPADELDTAGMVAALEALADLGVFHVALGGGEATTREDLFALGRRARELGLVPNLTLAGHGLTIEQAEQLTAFGQVNVSLDGVGARAEVFRSPGAFAVADRALARLRVAGVSVGINCVLGRRNADGLAELFAYAAVRGANEVEVLRFKPAGRADAARYRAERTTPEQNEQLLPQLAALAEKTGVAAKIDCSFVPLLCSHDPPREYLEQTGTMGCEAANVLLGARSDGRVAGCSFLPALDLDVRELGGEWAARPELERLRTWTERAPEPCASCDYLRLCKGGCRAVALALTGSLDAPDPDCPRVRCWSRESEAETT